MTFLHNPDVRPLMRCEVPARSVVVGVERKSGGTDVLLQNPSGSLILRSGLVVYAKPEC